MSDSDPTSGYDHCSGSATCDCPGCFLDNFPCTVGVDCAEHLAAGVGCRRPAAEIVGA